MAWTATLVKVTPDDQKPIARVEFTDGVKHKRNEPIDLNGVIDDKTLRARIEALRLGFEKQFTFIDALDPATFVLTPDPPKPPTADEQQRIDYTLARGRLQVLVQDVALGLLTVDAQEYKDQLTLVLSLRKVGF